jgi:hypothetical protein
MSWIESWENQGITTNTAADGKSGSSGVQRYFTLQAASIGTTTVQALGTAGLPLMNDPHPQNSSLRVRNRDVSQDGPISFSATISYEAQVNDPNDPAQNPLLRPAVVRFGAVTQEVEIDEDVDGDPIQTVNGEPIVGVTRPFTDLVITVQRNLPTFNPLSISGYMNKVNSATWYGLPAGTVRITDIQAGNVFSEDFEYWDVSISFQVRRGFGSITDAKAWWHRTAHQGYIINESGTKRIATTDDGLTVSQPVMLDLTTGAQLAAGVGAYIEFEVLEEIDFNGLNLL